MRANKEQILKHLKAFTIRQLFIEEFSWNKPKEPPLPITVDNQTYLLRPIADKSGVQVYLCDPNAQGNIPAPTTLRKIERELTKTVFEHILIYVDAAQENQVWQWVDRKQGKASRPHYNYVRAGQTGELLAQKLTELVFGLEDEPSAAEVAARNKKAFDTEPVTKKFYKRFQEELKEFTTFIEGILAQGDKDWYASLMLNRLMFIYFIQRQGFLNTTSDDTLNGEKSYLRNRLEQVRTQYGQDEFHTFYRYFLLNLFSELNTQEDKRTARPGDLQALLGKIPYLNGGLFDVHSLERDNPTIHIPDAAFKRIFDFFDEFDWHLDDRELKNDREINPDVLGYIFEKYINQKQMGAYYTKEDITEYISKNTIIPYLFEATKEDCEIAFEPGRAVWSQLRDNPDEYIYEAVAKGTNLPLPAEIEAGVHDVTRRTEWNKPAPEDFALPTEIWREVVARRQRYEEVHTKLANGEVTSINDLITYNLDICKFAQDIITYGEDTNLLNAFYKHIRRVTVLDPTCGSGAFLFAALNILKPLYEACLIRMQIKVDERERLDFLVDPKLRRSYPDLKVFQAILREVATHHNRDYFILKSIIINNLYGVDIMEEATEICKLRLFLKLVAQVERVKDIEPLPDIDFNIRAGNTLIGFTTLEDVRATVNKDIRSMLFSTDMLNRIEQKAKAIDVGFRDFRKLQTELQLEHWDIAAAKQDLRIKLEELNTELDSCLAAEYKIDKNNKQAQEYEQDFRKWQQSHKPFHWYAQFYGIMHEGGFDVIIGNPPYVEYSKVRKNYSIRDYKTIESGNLFPFVMERSILISHPRAALGLIIQLSAFSTPRMISTNQLVTAFGTNYISFYECRPGKLFEGIDVRLAIWLRLPEVASANTYTTRLNRFATELRPYLLYKLEYICTTNLINDHITPKLSTSIETSIASKLMKQATKIRDMRIETLEYLLYYSYGIRYWARVLNHQPYYKSKLTNVSTGEKTLSFQDKKLRDAMVGLMTSSLFFWFYCVTSDGHNFTKTVIDDFPVGTIQEKTLSTLVDLCFLLMNKLEEKAFIKKASYRTTGDIEYREYNVSDAKPIIDEIDRVLAKHYHFTDEELDFIINYDIKYRMGRNNGD